MPIIHRGACFVRAAPEPALSSEPRGLDLAVPTQSPYFLPLLAAFVKLTGAERLVLPTLS
jgi:hypothetical protein